MSTKRPRLQWSDGAAGPVLHLASVTDPRDSHWSDFAACAGIPVAVFYPEKGDCSRYPKRVCRACPVRLLCLEYALSLPVGDDFGIWGGTSQVERKEIRKQRKQEAA